MHIILALFFSVNLYAAANANIPFKKEVHFAREIYYIDGNTRGTPLKCGAYGNSKNEGIKLRLVSPRGLEFALDCRAEEVGDRFDLLVYKDSHESTVINGVLSKSSDCDISVESQAWLKDLNGDKDIDLVTRSKFKKIDGDCGGSGSHRILAEHDDLKVYYWKSGTFLQMKSSDEQLKQYKKEFDFSF